MTANTSGPTALLLLRQVDRYTKTKKSIYTGFELFSLKERDIPMEVLELPNKSEKIIDFAWEPKVGVLPTALALYGLHLLSK